MTAQARNLLAHLHRLSAPTTPDATLLTLWTQQRDQHAFAALMARHGPMVLGICRRLLGDVQEAEDVFQAAFLVLSRQASRLRQPESLAGFLHTIAVRLARKARRAKHCWGWIQTNAQAPEPIDRQPHPLDVLSGRELLALVDAEIARLPARYRLPVVLCLLQGRTIEEAARQLGWSIGSVRGRLARGRERLRQRLTRRGLDLSVGAVALLAPVAVRKELLAESLRHLNGPVPAAISALAGRMLPVLRIKLIGLALVLVTMVGLGTGLSLRSSPQPQTPAVPAPSALSQLVKNEPRRDRYGDPLPDGAVARLGTLRFRAPGEIISLAFAPDGQTVAVASYGGLFLFDAVSGKRLQQLSMQNSFWGSEIPMVFSPDGKRLARRGRKPVGQQSKDAVFVWDLGGKAKPRDYDAEHAMWIGWSTDGEPLALSLEKDALRLRELASGRSHRFECKDLQRPELYESVHCACAPDGKTLAVVDEKNQVHIWNIASGRERCVLRFKNVYFRALALSPDGRVVASLTCDQPAQTHDSIQLWDTVTGKNLHTLATDQKDLATILFTPDGKTFASVGWNDVRFWDVATGHENGRTQGKFSFSPMVAFGSDGKSLVTAERHSHSIQIWDVASGRRKPQPIGHRCRPYGTAFAPDGRRVATGGSLDGTIHIWDPETGESLSRIHRPGEWVREIAFSVDGRSLFSTWTDDELWMSGAVSGGKQYVLRLIDPDRPDTRQSAISMYQSADGKRLVVLSYYYPKKNGGGPRCQDTLITGWDTSTRKQLFRRRRPGIDSWVALSPDARVLAVPHPGASRGPEDVPGKGPMRLEDVETGELLLTFPALEGQTWPLAFSPDGRLLAANNSDYRRSGKSGQSKAVIQLWETATAAEVMSFPGVDNNRVALSPDGRLLAATEKAKEILVYDLTHHREQQRFTGFGADVTWLAFSPDSHRLISGLADSTLLVWEVNAPSQPQKLSDEAAAKAWDDLAGKDARRAFRARGTLASSPNQALKVLKARLHPAQAVNPQRLRRLLTDLESEQFAVREKAQKELEALGDLAEPALREALENKPTLEVRRRVQELLERLRGPLTKPELLQALRAVAVLEDIGTPAARSLLEDLAKGAPEVRLTREAKASLQRLDRRGTSGARE